MGSIVNDVQEVYPESPAPQIALAVTIICGCIIVFMGLARLGFIIDFIPLPSIMSFMTGSAIMVCSGQVKTLLGETADFDTSSPAYRIIIDTLKYIPSSKKYDASMGISALVILYAIRATCTICANRYPSRAKLFFFLSALRTVFVILLFTMISAVVNVHRRENPVFAIVGQIPRGFEHAGIPVLRGDVIKLFVAKLPACVVVMLLEHIAIAKSFGRTNNYTINPSQELIAIGATNLLSPFLGAYATTGSFSRSAIQSKAGSRTPLTGIITASMVLTAMYALTSVIYYIPHASLSSVIIHAVGDLIVAPSTIYQFWQIAPLDAVIFAAGLIVAITNTVPNSIYATVCMSLAVLLFRHAKAPGNFLGWAWTGEVDGQRRLYLPTDDSDAEPDIKLERPRPGVFIYRFSEGFDYPNAAHYTDALVQTIIRNTRRTNTQASARKGDRPWNDPGPGTKSNQTRTQPLPLLRAIIFDFSAVNNVDVTSIQNLVDLRNQLDRRSTPLKVQWHFAHIRNKWTKRALAAAGFGSPSPGTSAAVIEGEPVECPHFQGEGSKDMEAGEKGLTCKRCDRHVEAFENKLCHDQPRSVPFRCAARPFFHVDLTRALESVDAYIAANPAE